MTLIDRMMNDCVIMNEAVLDDGEGGFNTTWTEGAVCKVAITNDTSLQAKIAEKDGFTNTYTLTTTKDTPLAFGKVIKRLSDGLILKVTNDKKDFPEVASANVRKYKQFSAERWELAT